VTANTVYEKLLAPNRPEWITGDKKRIKHAPCAFALFERLCRPPPGWQDLEGRPGPTDHPPCRVGLLEGAPAPPATPPRSAGSLHYPWRSRTDTWSRRATRGQGAPSRRMAVLEPLLHQQTWCRLRARLRQGGGPSPMRSTSVTCTEVQVIMLEPLRRLAPAVFGPSAWVCRADCDEAPRRSIP
jgi:hypothetical protein